MKSRIDMKKMILTVFAAVAVAGSAGAQSGVQYPYVTNENGGAVVVLRDSEGGIDTASLFSSRLTETMTGDTGGPNNRMSRKFRVQKGQIKSNLKNWAEAINYCDSLSEDGYSNWRLPTQRELMIIWMLGGSEHAKTGYLDENNNPIETSLSRQRLYEIEDFEQNRAYISYWSSTTRYEMPYEVAFHNGETNYIETSAANGVRCVRDEW